MFCIFLFIALDLVLENAGKEMFITTDKSSDLDKENVIDFQPSQTEVYFRVKACNEAMIYLTYHDNATDSALNIQLLFGSRNRPPFIKNMRERFIEQIISPIDMRLSCTLYTEMWIEILSDRVTFGNGTSLGQGTLVQMTLDSKAEPRQMVPFSQFNTAQWKFHLPDDSNHQMTQRWKVVSDIVFANMTRDIVMTTKRGTFPDCAKACKAHHDCLSFVFNSVTHACQGHSENFMTLKEGDGHVDKLAKYFICVRRVR